MIEIDGSLGEGGGSIVRISAALSALTSKPFHIFNIRSNRPKGGLAAQHMNAVKSVALISNAQTTGLDVGSTQMKFRPGDLNGGDFDIDVKTAGGIGLILQAFMIVSPFAGEKSHIQITGGTDNQWAPSVDYIKNVTLPILEKMGYKAKIELLKRGHYPKGGGKAIGQIYPIKKLNPINLLNAEIDEIKGISHATNLPLHVAERQARAAEYVLKKTGHDIDIEIEHSTTGLSPGSGIVVWTQGNTRLGGSSIGKRGKTAEIVGQEAAKSLLNSLKSNSALDEHMGDQIIPYMALAGNSEVKISKLTMHTLTNLNIVDKFITREFEVYENNKKLDFYNLSKDLIRNSPVLIKSN